MRQHNNFIIDYTKYNYRITGKDNLSYLEKIRYPVIESALGEIHIVCMANNE